MNRYLIFLALLLGTVSLTAQTPNVASLFATGTNIKWYDAPTGGNLLPSSTVLVNGQHYYASQTINGCESTTRLDVVASLVTVAVPVAGTHVPSQTQIVWNWNAVTGATGYKWNTSNTYSSAADLGNVLTHTETPLTCNTAYTRYIWAYNASGCVSGATILTSTTSVCGSGDAIYDALSTSKASYAAALANDLVKITSAEYDNVKTALTTTTAGYSGAVSDYWATGSSGANTTFSYNSNSNDNTVATLSALNYPVAFSFHPVLNPQGPYTCQLKYNNSGTVVNISNLYSGATIAVQDRQYFVIKTPGQLPNATPYISIYSSAGVATIYGSGPTTYWSWVSGNVTGSATFTDVTGAITQLPSIQVFQTASKQWP